MQKSVDLDLQADGGVRQGVIPKQLEETERSKFVTMLAYAVVVMLSSLLFNTPQEIWVGFQRLTVSPSILVSDYMEIGNVGAAFFNSGLLMIVSIYLAKISDIKMNGTIVAAVLTVGGFAFFGKNIYNIWPIFIGVYFYSRVQKESFGKFILPALFGTALGPLVSQVSFGYDLPTTTGIAVGIFCGILAGFIVPPLANHVIKFHQGFNLYNIGFTAGVTGTLFMAFFRAFGFENPTTMIAAEGYNFELSIYFGIMFISMIVLGYLFNGRSLEGYDDVLKVPGQLVADFVTSHNFGLSLINMGLIGLMSTGYVILVGGEINGPIIGGILTIVGFGAFGKHAKNIVPLFIGVYLATLFQVWEVNSTGALLAALFGTTLAPIAGEFGWKCGILAGIVHMSMVMNVGSLHGGMNLYNNGFAGGIGAAILVPILIALKNEPETE
ncbi:DUF1576 domain-containing protein [Natroniella sulfidigena]|uniref:DUF1576 domain-containing protein n=1 Tax=Natroniella sulfidigena TaxID=723921 RepID=UPI00200A7889|nr:DUF1576 domain-containing protein [Natroniella sulfidigena]MCK8817802.1 DUF1576 domain-containing protein [Natroniella sulfidigena]